MKPVLSGHSKIDKTKVLKPCGSLMQVKVLQNAPREHSAILLTCIKRLLVLKTFLFLSSLNGRFRQVLLYTVKHQKFIVLNKVKEIISIQRVKIISSHYYFCSFSASSGPIRAYCEEMMLGKLGVFHANQISPCVYLHLN